MSANDLADRLEQIADPNFPGVMGYTAAKDVCAAAALLREQAEQLHRWEMSDALQRDPDHQGQYVDSLIAERDELRRQLDTLRNERVEAVKAWEEMKLPVGPGTGRAPSAVPFLRLDQIMQGWAAAGGGVPETGATHADQHLIQFTDNGWTIAHPLSERIDLDSLFDCPMRWEHADPGVRGVFVLDFDGTLGDEVHRG